MVRKLTLWHKQCAIKSTRSKASQSNSYFSAFISIHTLTRYASQRNIMATFYVPLWRIDFWLKLFLNQATSRLFSNDLIDPIGGGGGGHDIWRATRSSTYYTPTRFKNHLKSCQSFFEKEVLNLPANHMHSRWTVGQPMQLLIQKQATKLSLYLCMHAK